MTEVKESLEENASLQTNLLKENHDVVFLVQEVDLSRFEELSLSLQQSIKT